MKIKQDIAKLKKIANKGLKAKLSNLKKSSPKAKKNLKEAKKAGKGFLKNLQNFANKYGD